MYRRARSVETRRYTNQSTRNPNKSQAATGRLQAAGQTRKKWGNRANPNSKETFRRHQRLSATVSIVLARSRQTRFQPGSSPVSSGLISLPRNKNLEPGRLESRLEDFGGGCGGNLFHLRKRGQPKHDPQILGVVDKLVENRFVIRHRQPVESRSMAGRTIADGTSASQRTPRNFSGLTGRGD